MWRGAGIRDPGRRRTRRRSTHDKEGSVQLTRRGFLKLGGAAAAAGMAPVWAEAAFKPRPDVVWKARTPDQMPEPDLAALLLSRAAFGARPGDVEAVRAMGEAEWIEQQLDFQAIDNSDIVRRIEESLLTIAMTPEQLLDLDERGRAVVELHAATLYHMIFSPRLIHESLVEFWSDHFNIDQEQGLCYYFKTVDDRDVIRPNAISTFKQILSASAHSPAMLNYLNNDVSTKGRPNENYGREIMELHSQGVAVNGYPYTEEDVKEVARCLTGWSWDRRQGSQTRGRFEYRAGDHDNGAKTVLGQFIPASQGIQDGNDVLDILVNTEAAPKFIATKMVRRYVTDDPLGQTPDLVDKVVQAYTLSGGDVAQMMRTILHSDEFANSFGHYGGRLSRPVDLTARTLRSLGVTVDDVGANIRSGFRNIVGNRGFLTAMGHVPFHWPTPDGYPDVKVNWTASATMLARWNLGLAAAGAVDQGNDFLVPGFNPVNQMPELTTAGAVVDWWIDRLLHRPMLAADRGTLIDYLTKGGTETDPVASGEQRIKETAALILDSPYFQWR